MDASWHGTVSRRRLITGAATAAVGVWWLVTHPKAAVAVVPQGAGIGLVARF